MNADERRFFLVYLRHLRPSAASALRKNDSRCSTAEATMRDPVSPHGHRSQRITPWRVDVQRQQPCSGRLLNRLDRSLLKRRLRRRTQTSADSLWFICDICVICVEKERFAMPDGAIEPN